MVCAAHVLVSCPPAGVLVVIKLVSGHAPQDLCRKRLVSKAALHQVHVGVNCMAGLTASAAWVPAAGSLDSRCHYVCVDGVQQAFTASPDSSCVHIWM